jgi:hypothetical protein
VQAYVQAALEQLYRTLQQEGLDNHVEDKFKPFV